MRAHALRGDRASRMLGSSRTFLAGVFIAGLLGALGVAGPALGATPVGGEFQVNSYTTSFQRIPSVAVDADGDFVVVWESTQGAFDSFFRSIQGQRWFHPQGHPPRLRGACGQKPHRAAKRASAHWSSLVAGTEGTSYLGG